MEENILPLRSSSDAGSVKEERRLAYVGITKAQRTLTMTSARHRKNFGDVILPSLSRFIEEMPEEDLIRIGGNTESSD